MAAELERLSPLVGRLLAPNPSPMTLTGTNTYLIGRAEVAVIDPGPDLPEHVDAIVAALEALGRPAISLVTHHHGDHLPAAIRLRERLGVPVGGHAELPGVDRALAHDDLVILADARLRALHTPGHTPDHVCYLLEDESALFSGDLMAGTGTVRVGDGRGELADYLASLDLVADVEAAVLYPGHGPIVDDPAARIAEYREHRLGRERQVLEALGAGCTTVAEVVERLYADVPRHLHAQAGRNVLAHLMKLEDEGRVQTQSHGWRLVATGT
jgi:glyoxylase-like metal-dependent hydrolase (beta-lactamase superfamily II)